MSLIQTPAKKQKRRLVFNDTVEVYFYPENREQHESNEESEYEDDSSEPCYENEDSSDACRSANETPPAVTRDAICTRNNF